MTTNPGSLTVTQTLTGNTFASSGVTITGGTINSTTIGASTPSTGAFTTLSSSGATNLATAGASAVTIATTGTGTVAIGNATGTFALTSSGGLNVTTGGALTGVASLDTIATSATALTFAGAGTISSTGANTLALSGGATGALNLTGNAASSFNYGTNALTITSGTGASTLNTTATGINATQIGATTAASGAFTTLTSTGVTGLGNNSATVAIDGTNFDLSTAGVITLAGAQTKDITTTAAATSTALVIAPGDSTVASGTGSNLTLRGSNQTGTASVGGNLVLQGGTGALTNGLVQIGTANTSAITLGVASIVTTAAGGLTVTTGQNLIVNGDSFTDLTGNAGLAVSGSSLIIDATTTGTTATASSNSGLEIGSDGLRLLGGCTGSLIVLKWNTGTSVWECAADNDSGGATAWNNIGDATLNGAIAFGSTVQTLDWATMDANASFFTFNFTNAGTVAGTDSSIVINNASNTASSTDAITENLLLIQQLDTATGNSIVVNNGILVDSAAAAGMVDGIEITNSGGNITGSGLNIVDTAGGTFTTGITMSGTFTNLIDAPNFDVDNAGTVTIATGQSYTGSGTVTLSSAAASALTINSGTTGTIAVGDDASAETINLGTGNAIKTINMGTGTAGNTINIGTNNTTLDTINIGSALDDVAITGDQWSITNAGVLTVASCTGCGGGAPDTASFADTTPAAMADNNTTELFNDATKPNIVTDSTTATVLVSVVVTDAAAAAADDEYDAVRVVRSTTGTDASCSTDVQVGTIMQGGFVTVNTQPWGTSGTFLDSPATAGTIKYTVCTSAQSVGTVNNTPDRVEVTLVELGADLAENYYTNDDSIGPGDVVSIDPSLPAGVKRSSKPYDIQTIGVVSTAPGITLDDAIGLGHGRAVPVALAGRIPVKVSTENGRVKTGDLLTPSSTAGVAMKATKAGQIIGQALQDFSYQDGEIGLVMTFVKTVHWNGGALVNLLPEPIDNSQGALGKTLLSQFVAIKQSLELTNLSEILADRIAVGLEIITPQVTTDDLVLNTIKPVGVDIIMELGADGRFVIRNPEGKEAIVFDAQGNAKFAGTVTVDKIKANQIEGLEIYAGSIKSLGEQIAQLSDQNDAATDSSTNQTVLGTTTGSDSHTSGTIDLGNLKIQTATVALDLTVQGILYASGGLTVDGLAQFNGESIFDKLVTFNHQVDFKDIVSFEGAATFNNDAGGFATIHAGQQEVKVKFDKPYAQVPAVTVNIKDGQFVAYSYKDLMPEGFTIVLKEPAASDLEFAWTALSIKDAQTAQAPTGP